MHWKFCKAYVFFYLKAWPSPHFQRFKSLDPPPLLQNFIDDPPLFHAPPPPRPPRINNVPSLTTVWKRNSQLWVSCPCAVECADSAGAETTKFSLCRDESARSPRQNEWPAVSLWTGQGPGSETKLMLYSGRGAGSLGTHACRCLSTLSHKLRTLRSR